MTFLRKNSWTLRDRGFSLIELLAILGVIAVLIGLMLPALSKAREKAREVACASELRSLGERITLYSMDANGRVPFIYHRDRLTGLWSAPNGVAVPDGYLETSGDFWVFPMLEEFGRRFTHDALLCPNDWVTQMEAEQVAADAGRTPNEVFLPMTRTISRAFYRSAASLRRDGLDDHADPLDRVSRLADVAYPSSKALLIEDPPFHDDFVVGELFNVSAEIPFRRMVAGVDLGVSLRSIKQSPSAVVPSINVYPNYPGDAEQFLESQRLLSAFHYTRDGVLGRDW